MGCRQEWKVAAFAILSRMDEFLGFYLSALGNHVRAATNEALAPLGLDTRKLGVLHLLSARPELSQRQIADLLRMDRTTTMSAVESMERQGWLVRERGEDARKNALSLTTAGAKLTRQAAKVARQVEDAALRPLTAQHRRQLLLLLGRAVAALPARDV